jgi:SpoIIAA-like
MLRQMNDMPAGTIGFEAVGEVEDDDWKRAVEPLLRREIADGEKVRLLYLLGPEADDVEGDALQADAGFRARHAKAFERVAVVTDENWMKPALRAVSVLMPGSARGFAVHDLPAAKAWLAEGLDEPA